LKPASDISPIRALLAETSTLTLSTIDPDGTPRATPVFFAFDDQATLIFLSDRDTPHCRNLERQPAVAAALYPEVSEWRELRGLQIKGRASTFPTSEQEAALAVFADRFPFVRDLEEVVSQSEVYRLRPSWVRLVDNRQGFGYKREWSLE
jgi:uncharacterized protein YhbP (UPF0306 family)